MPITATIAPSICAHCGQISATDLSWNEKDFCCRGCLSVYQLLESQNLTKYYEIRDVCAIPVSTRRSNFSHVEMPEFVSKYAYGNSGQFIDIHVGGAQCAACIWLLEKLPNYVPEIVSARLSLGTQTLKVERKVDHSFRPAFEQIEAWGYVPHAIQSDSEQSELLKLDYKTDLFRIGVSAFAAGNVMLMAIALYAGVEGSTKILFQYTSLLLTLMALGYSALPLFRASLRQLKSRRISVDLPISIAVLTAFGVSLYGLIYGSEIYFDSITALIFLILTTRFTFKRVQAKHLSEKASSLDLEIPFARKLVNGEEQRIIPEEIRKSDQLRILENEIIPVDGTVEKGLGFVNQSLLTGESIPTEISRGGFVFMGSKLISGELQVRATEDYRTSRIPTLLHEIESDGPKPDSLLLTEKVGQFFLYIVFAIVAFILAWKLPTNPADAVYRALSFIIVACPCTFASVVPLVLALSLRQLRKRGVFIRNATVFEKIKRIQNIYFDKTGTLTEGDFEVTDWKWHISEDLHITGRIYSALVKDQHPVSKAIAAYILDNFGSQLTDEGARLTLIPSRGVEASFEGGDVIRVLKTLINNDHKNLVPNFVRIYFNNLAVASVRLGDAIRSEASEVVSDLEKMGYRITLLSGDQAKAVNYVGDAVGIPHSQRYHDLTLDQKADILKRSHASIMVGDGNNDTLAIQAATIGISVSGSVETALKSSDVYLANKNLSSLVHFLKTARRTNRLVNQALVISVLYNVTAGSLAILGIIHPLLAALIMPANALTSLAMTFWSLRKEA